MGKYVGVGSKKKRFGVWGDKFFCGMGFQLFLGVLGVAKIFYSTPQKFGNFTPPPKYFAMLTPNFCSLPLMLPLPP